MNEICCNKCDFIKRDGKIFCLLDMHIIKDIDKKFECEILNKYNKFRNGAKNV